MAQQQHENENNTAITSQQKHENENNTAITSQQKHENENNTAITSQQEQHNGITRTRVLQHDGGLSGKYGWWAQIRGIIIALSCWLLWWMMRRYYKGGEVDAATATVPATAL
ncbi:hypothetical protein Pcinc_030087 [Petrolisthes cinctipes]|uniref:Uncharacterized protein n=1 Tax=Petrolisthes cinctipes TaxID=88211 RepID=A0AAE1EZJ9_PETCI|nr:hypothetical protein Pcinc_030087 [Petrolisthes cinctipes]